MVNGQSTSYLSLSHHSLKFRSSFENLLNFVGFFKFEGIRERHYSLRVCPFCPHKGKVEYEGLL